MPPKLKNTKSYRALREEKQEKKERKNAQQREHRHNMSQDQREKTRAADRKSYWKKKEEKEKAARERKLEHLRIMQQKLRAKKKAAAATITISTAAAPCTPTGPSSQLEKTTEFMRDTSVSSAKLSEVEWSDIDIDNLEF